MMRYGAPSSIVCSRHPADNIHTFTEAMTSNQHRIYDVDLVCVKKEDKAKRFPLATPLAKVTWASRVCPIIVPRHVSHFVLITTRHMSSASRVIV